MRVVMRRLSAYLIAAILAAVTAVAVAAAGLTDTAAFAIGAGACALSVMLALVITAPRGRVAGDRRRQTRISHHI